MNKIPVVTGGRLVKAILKLLCIFELKNQCNADIVHNYNELIACIITRFFFALKMNNLLQLKQKVKI